MKYDPLYVYEIYSVTATDIMVLGSHLAFITHLKLQWY